MGYLDRLKKESESDAAPVSPLPRISSEASRIVRPQKRIVQDIAPPEEGSLRLQPRPTSRSVAPRGRFGRPEEAKDLPSSPPLPNETKPSRSELEIAVHVWEPDPLRKIRRKRRLTTAVAAFVLLLGAVLPIVVFPRFSVTIIPKVETVNVPAMEFVADTDSTTPQASSRRLPAIEVSANKTVSASFESSGKKFLQERARGTVLLYNAFSSAPQALVANTRLQDPSGKIFRLRSSVTVPGAQVSEGKIVPTFISGGVVAEEPGEAFNIEPTEFRIPGFRGTPKYQAFSAKSEEAFIGGFVGEARIVEPEDLRRASEELTRTAIETLGQELAEKIPGDPDFFSPPGTRELVITRIDQPRAGERHDQFTVSVHARGRAVVIRKSHLSGILLELLLPPDKDTSMARVSSDQPELILGDIRLGPEGGEMRLTASGKLAFWREADRAAVASVLHASTPKKAEAYLRGREEIGAFRIERFPPWLWFIPAREDGLKIDVEPPI